MIRKNDEDVMFMSAAGNVGIGTVGLPQNKLEVAGTIRAYEILVEDGWQDRVFEADYHLSSLEEEANFIEENGHLSQFESEEAMGGEILLKDVTVRQQIAIEEMMLHMIELNERLKALEEENKALKAQLNK